MILRHKALKSGQMQCAGQQAIREVPHLSRAFTRSDQTAPVRSSRSRTSSNKKSKQQSGLPLLAAASRQPHRPDTEVSSKSPKRGQVYQSGSGSILTRTSQCRTLKAFHGGLSVAWCSHTGNRLPHGEPQAQQVFLCWSKAVKILRSSNTWAAS